MTYITKERAPLTSALVNDQLGRMVPLPPHQGCHAYAQKVIEHAAQMEEGWMREADDVDKLLRLLGLDPEQCRSEGGLLIPGRAANLLRERGLPTEGSRTGSSDGR